jgi:superfamily II DNA or RNA helicase
VILTLVTGNTWTYVDPSASDDVAVGKLCESLSILDPKRHKDKRFKDGDWDGVHYFTDGKRFPTGLLTYVLGKLEGAVKVEVQDAREWPEVSPVEEEWISIMGERREYQVATVRKALKEKRGIIAAATGAGKTVMMKAIVQALNLKTIVMVPTAALLTQTHRSFKASDFDVGMVGGGHADFDKPVVVATAQSLYARLAREGDLAEKLSEFGLFFFDECHQAQAETYWDVIMECEAPYRFGLSGTPLRNDIRKDFRLVGAIGPVIDHIRVFTLVQQGFLAKPYVVRLPYRRVEGGQWYSRPYAHVYNHHVAENAERNAAVVKAVEWLAHHGRTILVVVRLKKHGKQLQKLLEEAGVKAQWVSGDTCSGQRDSVIRRLGDGELQCVIGTSIFDQGVDAPAIDAVVMAVGERADVRIPQRVGRGLRRKDGDNTCVIVDFLDTSHRWMKAQTRERNSIFQAMDAPIFMGWDALVQLPGVENHVHEWYASDTATD